MNVFAKWTAVAGLVVAVASSLTCSVDPVTFSAQRVEDCGAPGDEDGNGTTDCMDPACVDTPSCPAVCGNVFVELGEACDDGNRVDGDGCEANCTLPRCGNEIVDQGEACDDGNVVIGDGCDASCVASSQVYVKASNTGVGDYFGNQVALSADGTTMAVGSLLEDSKATGINGDQADNTMPSAGAVYIFVRTGATWSQQAYVKASNTGSYDYFGYALALSADGSTLAVGAYGEASAATGINGNQNDNTQGSAGAVYVFTRSGVTWSQQAYVKASNTGRDDNFGNALALSGDGATLAVGALLESSAATGINGDQFSNAAPGAGAVYVFTRSGGTWSQQAYIKASNTADSDYFGNDVALSGDGATLAVGAFQEDSAATGIDGNQNDNSAGTSGAVYVYVRSGSSWSQQAYVKASNTSASNFFFGDSVALSTDGATLAVGAYGESSAATGINGNQNDNTQGSAGAVYVFVRSGASWTQQAYVKASNTEGGDVFGWGVALAGDGATLAVSAFGEDSSATGIGGNQADNTAPLSGAVYVFGRTGTTWRQRSYVKASNTEANDIFGYFGVVALSSDAGTLAVAAPPEDGAATGLGGNQASNAAQDSGAVYVYR